MKRSDNEERWVESRMNGSVSFHLRPRLKKDLGYVVIVTKERDGDELSPLNTDTTVFCKGLVTGNYKILSMVSNEGKLKITLNKLQAVEIMGAFPARLSRLLIAGMLSSKL